MWSDTTPGEAKTNAPARKCLAAVVGGWGLRGDSEADWGEGVGQVEMMRPLLKSDCGE